MHERLTGKVAVVTGGGAGIGQATCLSFAKEGAVVAIAEISEEDGTETKRLIQDTGGEAVLLNFDVSKAENASRIADAVFSKYGHLEILVNNVGGSIPGRTIVEVTEDFWDSQLNLNLRAAFLMSKYVVPKMIASGGGAIVNVASGAGVFGMPRNPAYCAAKGGIVALTKSMAIDFAAQKIRVNSVSPGIVLTPLARKIRTPEEIEGFSRINLMGRAADPMELAKAILFLASDDASFITGQVLNVDGGIGLITGK